MDHQDSASLKKTLQSGRQNPFWVSGPCVIEDRDLLARVGETLAEISQSLDVPVVFKASFDKANRTAHSSFRGVGLEQGLKDLLWVKEQFGLPLLTDVHESSQVSAVAEVVDILQIPAFLCRQTDLLKAACETGRAINVKKGQFLSPSNVKAILDKLEHFGSQAHWITERGFTLGYQRLVVDFSALPEMERAGADMILDVTHSVQLPGGEGDRSGGIREAIPYLARAGAAAGVMGFFAETHPDPSIAKSDGANAWPLHQLRDLMASVKAIAQVAHG